MRTCTLHPQSHRHMHTKIKVNTKCDECWAEMQRKTNRQTLLVGLSVGASLMELVWKASQKAERLCFAVPPIARHARHRRGSGVLEKPVLSPYP